MTDLYLFALYFVFIIKVNGENNLVSQQDYCKFDINYRDRTSMHVPNRCEKSPYLMVEKRNFTSLHWCIAIDNRIAQFETLELGFESTAAYALNFIKIHNFKKYNEEIKNGYHTELYNISSVELPILMIDILVKWPLIRSIKLDGEEMCSSEELVDPNSYGTVNLDLWKMGDLMMAEYLSKCRSSINRRNRTATQCTNLNNVIVEKLSFNDDNKINCVIVDRTNSLLKNEDDKLIIVSRHFPPLAIWAGDKTIREQSKYWNTFVFNLKSDRFFFVFHADENTAAMVDIKLNGQETCGQFVNITETNSNSTCGARKINHRGLITFGSTTYHGKYPWHAAIYRLTPSHDASYICGGNIVSTNVILTAAHCIQNSDGIITPYMLRVQLAKYDLSVFNMDSREHRVAEVIPHFDYQKDYFENDIAILKLVTYITYSNYIQPICINDNRDHEAYINEVGFVPGWGKNEKQVQHPELHEAAMPIVEEQECRRSKREFFSTFLNSRKFCAGFRNGTSVCGGDSGGGLVFELDGIWYLKGIISLGVAHNFGCDFLEYVLFTDVTKYVDWINNNTLS